MENSISESARIYKNVRLVRCTIKDHVSIGDDSDVVESVLLEKSELGRRNLMRNSTMGKGSYTGTNTIIKNTTIGNYCSIG